MHWLHFSTLLSDHHAWDRQLLHELMPSCMIKMPFSSCQSDAIFVINQVHKKQVEYSATILVIGSKTRPILANAWFDSNEIPDILPQYIRQLEFRDNFNLPAIIATTHLEHCLIIRSSQELPQSLRQLTFNSRFNHLIETGVVPQSLEQLTLGEYNKFNHPISAEVLPQQTNIIEMCKEYYRHLERQ